MKRHIENVPKTWRKYIYIYINFRQNQTLICNTLMCAFRFIVFEVINKILRPLWPYYAETDCPWYESHLSQSVCKKNKAVLSLISIAFP